MTIDPAEGRRAEGAGRPETTDAELAKADIGRRAENLGVSLASLEKDFGGAETMLGKVKDPAKREEFRSALASLRGRAGGAGNALRAAVTGLALFAGGMGIGKGMSDERHEAAMTEMARRSGETEAENRMLKAELAKKGEAPAPAEGKGADKAIDALARENAASRQENAELRKQAEALMAEIRQLRDARDAAARQVIDEKEKGLKTQEALMKQQAVTANMGALFDKMNALINQSSDKGLKEELARFLEAYE